MPTPFDEIEWIDSLPSPTSDVVAQTENVLGTKLPPDFLAFCGDFHGGFPDPDEIEVDGFGRTMINQILPLVDVPEENIRSIVTVFQSVEGLPSGLIPFASEPGGNYFCFDCRSEELAVVFWYHEQDTVFPIGDSFTQFIQLVAEA